MTEQWMCLDCHSPFEWVTVMGLPMPLYALGDSEPRVPTTRRGADGDADRRVELGAEASVWFGAVLRGDFDRIVVGAGSCIQDNAVVHAAEGLPTMIAPTSRSVTRRCSRDASSPTALISMGAIVLQRARIGAGSLVAAGSVVREGQEIPPGVVAAGAPAVVKKEVDGLSRRWIERCPEYRELRRRLLEELEEREETDGEDADRGRADRRDGDGRARGDRPATEDVYDTVPAGGVDAVELAVQAADAAFAEWSRTDAEQRDLIRKALDLIAEHRDEIVGTLTHEQGKPTMEAAGEPGTSSTACTTTPTWRRRSAAPTRTPLHPRPLVRAGDRAARRPRRRDRALQLPADADGDEARPRAGGRQHGRRQARLLHPARDARVAELFHEAGLPAGVLNVHGPRRRDRRRAGDLPLIRRVAFTGETGTGKHIAVRAAPSFATVSLELGGSDPMIVCPT